MDDPRSEILKELQKLLAENPEDAAEIWEAIKQLGIRTDEYN